MKKKRFLIVLGIEAALCLAWRLAEPGGTAAAGLFSFPFEQVGRGLRELSLSGAAGNVLAIVLYLGICLIPAAALAVMSARRKLHPEDGLLAVLSVLLFYVLYLMINPGLLGKTLGNNVASLGVGKMMLGVVVYSVLAGYLTLRVLRRAHTAEVKLLQKYLRGVLYLLGAGFVWAVFGGCLGELQASLKNLADGNTAGGTGVSMVFLVLRFLVDALPYLLDTMIVVTGLDTLAALEADRYGETAAALARKLSGQCGFALAAAVLSNVIFNLLQLAAAGELLVIDGTVELPVFSILFVLVVLFLTRLLAENRKLKTDNDLFV